MRAVVQRVLSAQVVVADELVGAIDHGLLVYLGVGAGDEARDRDWMVEKLLGLRIFPAADGRMSLDVRDVGGALLVVSQFTLYGDVRKGRRPDFTSAMAPGPAEAMYRELCERVAASGLRVATGRFGADMKVSSTNDGPVTIVIDSAREASLRTPGAVNAPSTSG
jgi:D-tyrosyl-tRNA(Tyr) deacylase